MQMQQSVPLTKTGAQHCTMQQGMATLQWCFCCWLLLQQWMLLICKGSQLCT
jgi:hypothetical protein